MNSSTSFVSGNTVCYSTDYRTDQIHILIILVMIAMVTRRICWTRYCTDRIHILIILVTFGEKKVQ